MRGDHTINIIFITINKATRNIIEYVIVNMNMRGVSKYTINLLNIRLLQNLQSTKF